MLAREFARRGWEVHYVSENDRPDAPRELDKVSLHYLPELPHWRDANRKPLKKVIDSLQPDVIYNRVFNTYTALAMEFAPKNSVTIWAAAGNHDGEVTTTFGELLQTKSLKQFIGMIPRTLVTRTMARTGARSAKIQLAQSTEQLERLARQGFSPILLRNSLERPQEISVQTHEGKPVVLWVGSIKQWKRPTLFFDLARRCADLDCEFVMAGDLQDAQSEKPLSEAQRELKNFRYAGFVPPDLIGKLYDKAHLLVSTSRAEGFPNTFIQGWLRGAPVLSLDVNPDGLLSNDRFGAVANDMDGLEHKLRDFLADPDRRREIGNRAHEFAQKEFDLQANMDKLEELIRGKS